ncbi:MAG TPA: methyltransferase domain-containing protein [Anaerolineae bacterium]|nr:methyltransferase domain-containing protein [Anaerolineae bacterium]
MIRYQQLADRMNAAAAQMTEAQKEAFRRSVTARNLALPENAELWLAIQDGIGGDAYDGALSVPDMRAAMEELPLDSWATLNNVIFVLHRGNVFDEQWEAIPGGGIEYKFGPRYQVFLEQFEQEAARIREATGWERLGVLDVGCWQGTLVCTLLQRNSFVAGIDICEEVGPIVEERVAMLKSEHAHAFLGFLSGWAHERLPIPRGALRHRACIFDIVTCQETLEHVPTAVLQETCDAILGAARHAVLITVPGWDDGWPLHLRVFTIADFERLFHADKNEMVVLQEPGGGVYTTVLVRPAREPME